MPLFYCPKCHSEYEGKVGQKYCQWCGTEGFILEEETALEAMLKNWDEIIKKTTNDIGKRYYHK